MKISPYLIFNGQAEQAANFYAQVLGGRVENFYRFGQMPPVEGMPPMTDAEKNLIMHCCVDGGADFPCGTLSIADTLPSDPRILGTGHIVTIATDTGEQAETIWKRLSVGAQKIGCELQKTFYAQLYGELTDKFGVQWAVMFE